MTPALKFPKTLQEAMAYFSDPQRTFAYAVLLRWPDGKVICPRCGSVEHSFISTRRLWFCKGCKKQFTVKVGTIFEDSALGMDKWMIAVWMISNCRNGISSYEVGRSLGITQKSAWFVMHRLRLALREGIVAKFGGPNGEVEADETFVGGKMKNMHEHRRAAIRKLRDETFDNGQLINKAAVMGILDRQQRKVRAAVVPNVNREVLQREILSQIEHGSKVYTDEARLYRGLHKEYVHSFVNHVERYVNGRVHTNGLENFWSLLKRGLGGTYVAVEPFHLFRYIDEQTFRYNNRL